MDEKKKCLLFLFPDSIEPKEYLKINNIQTKKASVRNGQLTRSAELIDSACENGPTTRKNSAWRIILGHPE